MSRSSQVGRRRFGLGRIFVALWGQTGNNAAGCLRLGVTAVHARARLPVVANNGPALSLQHLKVGARLRRLFWKVRPRKPHRLSIYPI